MEKRRSERLLVDGGITCEVGGATTHDRLCDLSRYGCKLHHADATLVKGMAVEFTLIGDIEISGIVRWVDGEIAGIEFEKPLSRAAVMYFALPTDPEPDNFRPLDGFGRRLPPLERSDDIGAIG